jgi:hypothetical protein
MTSTELKKNIFQDIENIQDEKFLRMMYALLAEYKNNEIIGTIKGKTLTRFNILERAGKAEQDIKSGQIIPVSEVRSLIFKQA